MNTHRPGLNAIVGRILTGEYKKRGMRQEDLAEVSGIALTSLQKKLKGRSPIDVEELDQICRAMDPPLDLAFVFDEIEKLWGSMSVAQVTNDVQRKRIEKQAAAAAMSPAELDKVKRRAATTDPEHREDEHPAP